MTLETFRFLCTLTGAGAAGLLAWRLVGRWAVMDWIGRLVVGLLAASVMVFGLGAARAAVLDAPFNELLLGAFLIQCATIMVCLFWRRLLDPRREVRRL